MPITENTAKKLVLKSGSSVLTLDKDAGKAVLQRKVMFVNLKPYEVALSDISGTTVDAGVDRASGIEVCNTMLITKQGAGIALGANDKKEAEANGEAIRKFLGI